MGTMENGTNSVNTEKYENFLKDEFIRTQTNKLESLVKFCVPICMIEDLLKFLKKEGIIETVMNNLQENVEFQDGLNVLRSKGLDI